MATTSERIRDARKALGLTQMELAEKVGVKHSAIHKYETGLVVNLKRETINALAQALEVSPSWLMCLDGNDETVAPKDDGLTDYLEMLRNRPECRMLFSVAKDATKDDVEKAVAIIEALRKTEGKF